MRLFLPFIFAIVVISLGGVREDASAQLVSIETSADDHDNKFFGEGVLQVVVTDPNANDDNTNEDIQVNINSKPKSGSAASELFLVPETTNSSGRFEFFLVHIDATEVGADDLDANNRAGVEGDGTCVADCAPFITFGPGGDVDLQSSLFGEVTFEIKVDNFQVQVNYEETPGVLDLDRESYGTTSFVYISVIDQDGNLNPSQNDEFLTDPGSDPNDDLLVLNGGSFEGVILFRETGDNSAVFEGRYRLGVSMFADSESLKLTLYDKANYNASLSAPENDSNNIDEVSFTVGNSAGTVEVGGGQQTEPTWDPVFEADKDSYAIGETVHVSIKDQDADINPETTESIQLQVSSGQSQIEVSALETGSSTGVFGTTFRIADKTDRKSSEIEPGDSAIIVYTDERPADYFDKLQAGQNPEKKFSLEIDIQLPVKTGVEATDVAVPLIEDAAGGSGPYKAGASLTLSTTISNNDDEPQSFVALLDVRDSSGVTVFLALQSGTLEPSGSTTIGVLWQPDSPGKFEVRTFAVSQLGTAVQVLSPVAASEITVS